MNTVFLWNTNCSIINFCPLGVLFSGNFASSPCGDMLLLNNAQEGSEKKEKELEREKRLICGILLIFLRGGSSFGLDNI